MPLCGIQAYADYPACHYNRWGGHEPCWRPPLDAPERDSTRIRTMVLYVVSQLCRSCVSTHNHRWFITNRPIPQELYFQTFRRPRVYIWCRICHVWRWAINVSVGAVMPASRHLPSKGTWLGFDHLASHRKGWLCFWSSSGRSGARVGRGRSDLYVFLTSPLGLTRT